MTIKLLITTLCFAFAITMVFCQKGSPVIGRVKNPSFDKTIASMVDFSVPVLTVQEAKSKVGVTYLDAREPQEYEVSHIPGALYIGAKEFEPKTVEALSKDQTLVVYCLSPASSPSISYIQDITDLYFCRTVILSNIRPCRFVLHSRYRTNETYEVCPNIQNKTKRVKG